MSKFVDDDVYQGSVASQESYTYICEFMGAYNSFSRNQLGVKNVRHAFS